MRKHLLTVLALSLPFAAFAAVKARQPASEEDGTPGRGQLNCVMTDKAGKQDSFSIPLTYFQDKKMGAAEEDGAQGHISRNSYQIRYVTAAGSVECSECRTGATKVFYSTLSLTKSGKKDEAEDGAVFASLELQPKSFPNVKSLSCTYQPPGSPDDDKL